MGVLPKFLGFVGKGPAFALGAGFVGSSTALPTLLDTYDPQCLDIPKTDNDWWTKNASSETGSPGAGSENSNATREDWKEIFKGALLKATGKAATGNLCYDGFTTYGTFYEGIRGIKGDSETRSQLSVQLGVGEWECWKELRKKLWEIIFKSESSGEKHEGEFRFLNELWDKIETLVSEKSVLNTDDVEKLGSLWLVMKEKILNG